VRDLDMRERLLENAERKLDQRVDELKSQEKSAETGAPKRAEADAALKNLVVMYEAMKPKEAARVFDRLPHDVLVPVVLQMNPRKMAEVLAAMTPEAAEKLTIALAGRSRSQEAKAQPAALPPTELPAIGEAPR
jgi:flagellar motility protein MotE (MotC chaperone)